MSGSTKTQGKYRPREALPEGPLPDRSRKLAGAAIAEHRIYAEAAAGAGRGHVTATYQKPSAFFRAYEIGGETRSALLSMQSKPENAVCRPKKHPDRRTAEGDKPSKRKPDKHVVSAHEPVGTPGKPQGVRLVLAVVHRLLLFQYRPCSRPKVASMQVGAGAGFSGDPGAAGHADQATQSTRRKSVSLVNSHAAHVSRRRSGLLVKSCQTFAISRQC